MWGWHNRGCVWGNVASEWAGKEEWSRKRKRCQTTEDERFHHFRTAECRTFDSTQVKHWRQKEAEHRQEKTQELLGSLIHPSTFVKKDQRFVVWGAGSGMVGTSGVAQ